MKWWRLGKLGLKWGPMGLQAAKLLTEGVRQVSEARVGQLSDRVAVLEQRLAEQVRFNEQMAKDLSEDLQRVNAMAIAALVASAASLIIVIAVLVV